MYSVMVVGCHVHDNGEAPFPIPVYRQVAICHVVASAYPIPGVYERSSSDKNTCFVLCDMMSGVDQIITYFVCIRVV